MDRTLPSRRSRLLTALALAAITFLVLAPVLRCDFTTFDDADYVTANPHVQEGISLDSTLWAFTTFEHANWHPLTWLSLQLDFEINGKNPFGFHLTNLLLHSLTTSLLYLALLNLTGQPIASALAALLFGIHPLHVESVAWITERKDTLSTFFLVAALLSYARAAAQGRPWSRSIVTLLFAMSLLSKSMGVTFPLLLILLDVWPLRREPQAGPTRLFKLTLEKWPLFLLSLGSGVMTIVAQSSGGAVRAFRHSGLAERLANALHSYTVYLRQMVWPRDLVVLTPFERRSLLSPAVLAATAVLVVITLLAIRLRIRRPHLLTGWLWYLGTLLPVIGILSVGEHDHANRYTYFPLVGLFLALGCELEQAWRRWSAAGRTVLVCAGCVLLGALILQTRAQCAVWKNGETLWLHALERTRPTTTAVFGLASYYRNTRNPHEAARLFEKVLILDPTHGQARANLAWSRLLIGDLEGADRQFALVLPRTPASEHEAYQLGLEATASNQPGLAAAYFTHVLVRQPANAGAHLYLGMELLKYDQPVAALRHFEEARRLSPEIVNVSGYRDAVSAAKAAERARQFAPTR
ncbi:MAG TPA: glycosyltransferase family 39 protein [Caulifigura sp.]|nr:glycosyltransferase family 39 protein [Caulifigura sp.]